MHSIDIVCVCVRRCVLCVVSLINRIRNCNCTLFSITLYAGKVQLAHANVRNTIVAVFLKINCIYCLIIFSTYCYNSSMWNEKLHLIHKIEHLIKTYQIKLKRILLSFNSWVFMKFKLWMDCHISFIVYKQKRMIRNMYMVIALTHTGRQNVILNTARCTRNRPSLVYFSNDCWVCPTDSWNLADMIQTIAFIVCFLSFFYSTANVAVQILLSLKHNLIVRFVSTSKKMAKFYGRTMYSVMNHNCATIVIRTKISQLKLHGTNTFLLYYVSAAKYLNIIIRWRV